MRERCTFNWLDSYEVKTFLQTWKFFLACGLLKILVGSNSKKERITITVVFRILIKSRQEPIQEYLRQNSVRGQSESIPDLEGFICENSQRRRARRNGFFRRLGFIERDPFNQNFRKIWSKTQWIGSVQPEKFRKNGSTF